MVFNRAPKASILLSAWIVSFLDLSSAKDPGRRFTNVEQIPSSLEVVLRPGQSISDGRTRYFHGGSCFIDFPHNGRLKSGMVNSGVIPFEANKNSRCGSHLWGGGGNKRRMVYKLQGDGNLVCRCDGTVDYTSQTDDDMRSKNYVMVIDKSCNLHIFGGTMDCDKVDLRKHLFTSSRWGPLGPGDVIGKGEHVYFSRSVMVMDSGNGDLIVYQNNRRGVPTVVWRASEHWEWNGPPAADDYYYAKVTRDGHLVLVDYNYDADYEFEYFSMDLGTNGASCLTVDYDPNRQDFLARRC